MASTASSAVSAAPTSLRIASRASEAADAAKAVRFTFEGRSIEALEGDSIAMALWAAGIRRLRNSPTAGTARGVFCAMGSCQECVVRVNGLVKTSCNTPASEGLVVTALRGLRGQTE